MHGVAPARATPRSVARVVEVAQGDRRDPERATLDIRQESIELLGLIQNAAHTRGLTDAAAQVEATDYAHRR